MSSGSWKVAYADFMTAMMAFFLLMWLLNATTDEQKAGLAGYFTPGGGTEATAVPYSISNNPLIQFVTTLDKREFVLNEVEQSKYAIAQDLRQYLMQDALPSQYTGITSDGIGVLLHVSPNLMFEPGTTEFSETGKKTLDRVRTIMAMYQVYLIIRGHTDSSETGSPLFNNKWDLSAARANAAVKYLVGHGVSPNKIRSISYADTRPNVDSDEPDAVNLNGRVEFNFHRQDVMSNIVGY